MNGKMEWKEVNNQLVKKFTCNSFRDIISNLKELSIIADKMEHHPDFRVYNYRNIEFNISTHDTNSITIKDHELAQIIDIIFG